MVLQEALTSFLGLLLLHPVDFCMVVFSFASRYFSISSLISLLIHWFYVLYACCLVSMRSFLFVCVCVHVCVCVCVCVCVWLLVLCHWSEKMLEISSIFQLLFYLIFVPFFCGLMVYFCIMLEFILVSMNLLNIFNLWSSCF